MKKEYIFPITEISEIEILNMICESPDPFEQDDDGGVDGDYGQARCREDYGRGADFGSLW